MCIWGINGFIRTQYILGFDNQHPNRSIPDVIYNGGLKWSEMIQKEGVNPYDPNNPS